MAQTVRSGQRLVFGRQEAATATKPSAATRREAAVAAAHPHQVDVATASARGASASARFAALAKTLPERVVGHYNDGEPFLSLAALTRRTPSQVLTELRRQLVDPASELTDKHAVVAGSSDEALAKFTARGEAWLEYVAPEAKPDYASAIAQTTRFFFDKKLFAEVRLVETVSTGPQFGRTAVSLLGRAHTGEWFFVSQQLVG